MSEDRTTVLEGDEEEYDDDYRGPGRWIAIAAAAALALGIAGYFAGHASAGGGPSTLAEAVQQAQDGKLACGDTGLATPAQGGGDGLAGGPPAAGAPGGAGGGAFLLRAVCDRGQNAGAVQGRRGVFGGGGVVGQVQSVSGDTLVLHARQGGSLKLKLTSSTTVRKSVSGSLDDIKPGATVTVAGTGQDNENPATSITILPASQ